MEAEVSYETLVPIYHTTRHHILEDTERQENLNSHKY
jgi:hypothetical protein